MLKEGDRIPEFEVTDQDGNTVTEKNFEGKRIVLYFYPKDSTPGCTAEACNLRDNFDALKEAGYEIYGVSKDSQASHQKFIGKYSLPFSFSRILLLRCSRHSVHGERRKCTAR